MTLITRTMSPARDERAETRRERLAPGRADWRYLESRANHRDRAGGGALGMTDHHRHPLRDRTLDHLVIRDDPGERQFTPEEFACDMRDLLIGLEPQFLGARPVHDQRDTRLGPLRE